MPKIVTLHRKFLKTYLILWMSVFMNKQSKKIAQSLSEYVQICERIRDPLNTWEVLVFSFFNLIH